MTIKSIIKSVVRGTGFELVPTRVREAGGKLYTRILPKAMYAPWLDEREFMDVYAKISGNTLVDQYRCFELWELARQVRHLEGDVLEVGVWRGGTGALLARRMQGKRTYLADTFTGVVKAGPEDPDYRGGEHSDTSCETVEQLLAEVGAEAELLVGIYPDDFPAVQGPFCFVHIDVDAYQSAKDVFDFVWPRLSVGGVVIFDDYGFIQCGGIPVLIAEYRGEPDKLVVHNLNGHAVVVKVA